MESFQCTFTFNPTSDFHPEHGHHHNHSGTATHTALAVATSSSWPLKASPPKHNMSGLGNPTTTHGRALSTRDDERNAQGIPGGVYICQGVDWTEECDYVEPQINTCYSMEDWWFYAVGFGPDQGATCHAFT